MKELEAKILEVDRSKLEKLLLEMGASKSFDGEMIARFYDFPDGSIKSKGGVLRLRKEGDTTVLTHKKNLSREGAKIMEETETSVDDFGQMEKILLAVGLVPQTSTRKFRTQYDYQGWHAVFDDYQDELGHIPEFIEIEAPDIHTLHKVALQLGFEKESLLSWSTYELVKHYEA